ncbi:hypothetical protein ACOMHN_042977 [Nucella lapillus]
MAGMAGQFMGSCESSLFRDRIVAQIADAKECHYTDPDSSDPMEQFIAGKSPEQLEEFIFQNSKGSREEYLSLTAEMLLAVRQCLRKPDESMEGVHGARGGLPNGDTANGDHDPSAPQQTSS